MKTVHLYNNNRFWQQILNDILHAKESEELNRQILLQIVRITDYFNGAAGGHSVRVRHYAVQMAAYMRFDHKTQKAIRDAALLHDIGKIGIPQNLLLKKETLAPAEYHLIKRHPEIGSEILRHFPEYHDAVQGVLYHHERFDGSGYPYGLEKDDIPIEAQIIGLCDTFDALTTNRPYRKSLSTESAMEIIRHQTDYGKWNPFLFSVFEKIIAFRPSLSASAFVIENEPYPS